MDQNNLKSQRALIGSRLRKARLRCSATVEEAAKAAGVQPLAVQRWEKGQALPCLVRFRDLLALYGVIPVEILFEENPYRLTRGQVTELLSLTRSCSPALRARIELWVTAVVEPQTGRADEGASSWSAE